MSFTNLPTTLALRQVRSNSIGTLISISGTITRTTDVKPELIYGCVVCDSCGAVIPSVDQQFQFTKPTTCLNRECTNRSKFTLDLSGSVFTDWQRVKLQENTNEIPAGSMPRSMDLILRESLVESVKPGDKVVAVGSLIVIPDIAQMWGREGSINRRSRQGQVTTLHRKDGDQGVTGLRGLGVRCLT